MCGWPHCSLSDSHYCGKLSCSRTLPEDCWTQSAKHLTFSHRISFQNRNISRKEWYLQYLKDSKYKIYNYYDLSRRMGKPTICIGETKAQTSFAVTAKLISVFVFATRTVHILFLLIPNFKLLTFFCDCTARFVSDLVGTQIVGFLTQRLIYYH